MRQQFSKQELRDLLIHLRLHYQLLLAPIFVWGYFLADQPPNADFWLAFVAFHIFLYGGGTAFNSYYDRDEGPVGGLAAPPPVSPSLRPFSLAILLVGAALAALVNPLFLLVYGVMFGLGVAYCLPAIRLKGRPLLGLVTVAAGQGVLASLGGWVAASPRLSTLSSLDWMGIGAVTMITVGFYPLTQIYQIDEDLARGDVTFAAWAGPARAFGFALIAQGLAALLLIFVISLRLGWGSALLVGGFYALLLAATGHWALTFDRRRILPNYRRIMLLNALTSLGFLGFVGLHLFRVIPLPG